MRRIAEGVRNYIRAAALSNGGAGTTLAQQVAVILAKYGTDAHVYLPGIGVINGLTAGNYLDSAGTTAATVDNPVGLVLDAGGSVGSEKVSATYSGTANGSWLIGANSITRNGTTSQTCILTSLTSVSGTVRVSFDVSNLSGDTFTVSLNGGSNVGQITSNGSKVFYVTAVAGTSLTFIPWGGTAGQLTITNISIKEVTGIHASQATTANKPILRKGAVNLLTYSEQFDNAAWSKTAVTVSQNAINAPNGTLTADKLLETATTGAHAIAIGGATTGVTFTLSIYAKAAEKTQIALQCSNVVVAYFNLSAGTVVSGAGASIQAIGDGWYRCSVTATYGANVTSTIYTAAAGSVTTTGDGTSGIYIWGAQLETGSTASAYIPTTTAAASSAVGSYHWVHDSTDVLTATFPAGYESATTINASTAGQSTLTAQNIVGAYNIGASIDTYGRFVFRTGLTASELTIMQSFANRLAGL